MTLDELNKNVQVFDVKKEVKEILGENSELITDLNKDQLWSGKTNEGEDIRPYYSENPYFKKEGAAERYANWKAKITPDSRRKNDVPNLYVNGKFYSEIHYNKEAMKLYTNGSLASKVTSVHKNVIGLNKESTAILIDDELTPKLTAKLQAIL